MKSTYIFPALFEQDSHGISIVFPDLPGCLPCADTMEEAFKNAKEALQLHLYGMEEDGETIPEPSKIENLPRTSNQLVAMIDVWMPSFREKMLNKSTNKTVTIPRWLDLLAKQNHVNYSRLLQSSLKEYLGIENGASGRTLP